MLSLLGLAACAGDSLILPEDREPATLAILAGSGQADTVGRVLRDSLVVRVTDPGDRPIRNLAVHFLEQQGDQSGLPIIGASVSAAVASGGGTLGGQATISTDLLGIATFSDLSLTGKVGNHTLRISSGVLSATTTTIGLTPGPASPSQSTANVPSDGTAKRATVITVQTKDQSGNALTTGGHTVVITVTGKNKAGPLTASDNGDGSYTASYAPNKDGDDLIAITLDGTPIAGSPFPSEVD
jgi:hypothetical protein